MIYGFEEAKTSDILLDFKTERVKYVSCGKEWQYLNQSPNKLFNKIQHFDSLL